MAGDKYWDKEDWKRRFLGGGRNQCSDWRTQVCRGKDQCSLWGTQVMSKRCQAIIWICSGSTEDAQCQRGRGSYCSLCIHVLFYILTTLHFVEGPVTTLANRLYHFGLRHTRVNWKFSTISPAAIKTSYVPHGRALFSLGPWAAYVKQSHHFLC